MSGTPADRVAIEAEVARRILESRRHQESIVGTLRHLWNEEDSQTVVSDESLERECWGVAAEGYVEACPEPSAADSSPRRAVPPTASSQKTQKSAPCENPYEREWASLTWAASGILGLMLGAAAVCAGAYLGVYYIELCAALFVSEGTSLAARGLISFAAAAPQYFVLSMLNVAMYAAEYTPRQNLAISAIIAVGLLPAWLGVWRILATAPDAAAFILVFVYSCAGLAYQAGTFAHFRKGVREGQQPAVFCQSRAAAIAHSQKGMRE